MKVRITLKGVRSSVCTQKIMLETLIWDPLTGSCTGYGTCTRVIADLKPSFLKCTVKTNRNNSQMMQMIAMLYVCKHQNIKAEVRVRGV